MEKSMELKELTDRTLELFDVTSPDQLGPALLAACGDPGLTRGGEWDIFKHIRQAIKRGTKISIK